MRVVADGDAPGSATRILGPWFWWPTLVRARPLPSDKRAGQRSVEPGRLIVDDAPAVLVVLDHHTDEHADCGPVWICEVGVHIAQHLIGGQRAGLNDLIVDRHARRLARVIVDDSLAANAIGAQTLEDRVLGEYLGDPFGLLRVDCRLPAVQGITYGVSVRHFDHRPRARSRP